MCMCVLCRLLEAMTSTDELEWRGVAVMVVRVGGAPAVHWAGWFGIQEATGDLS